MKRFVVMAVLSILLAATVSAQQGPGGRGDGGGMPGKGQRMYDPSKVETVSGEVVAVKELTFRNGMRKSIGLKLNTGSQTMFVHLGPQWFIEQQSVKIAAGDKVEVTGVKTVRREKEVFVAGEVRKGGAILKLRDAGGVPLWAGSGPGGGKPQQ